MKNVIATLTLAIVMTLGATFARAENGNGGIIVAGTFDPGIIVAGFDPGIIVAGFMSPGIIVA